MKTSNTTILTTTTTPRGDLAALVSGVSAIVWEVRSRTDNGPGGEPPTIRGTCFLWGQRLEIFGHFVEWKGYTIGWWDGRVENLPSAPRPGLAFPDASPDNPVRSKGYVSTRGESVETSIEVHLHPGKLYADGRHGLREFLAAHLPE